MTVRPIILLAAIVFGLAAFMDEAAAQYYPAAPNYPAPYSYPQGGYRGAPDQDGIMNLDPDEDDDEPMPPQRQPQAGRPGNDPYQQGAPYPYNPRDAGVQPYDPGMNRPVPQQGYIPNQNSSAVPGAPYGHYGDRTAPGNANVPADISPDLRP
ncbi:MAG: hypothetical protein ABUL48_02490, partial [Pseudorhodoplanes sp.]